MSKNVFSKNKNYKKLGVVLVGILIIVCIFTGIRIQSASSYQKEQQSLQAEYEAGNDGSENKDIARINKEEISDSDSEIKEEDAESDGSVETKIDENGQIIEIHNLSKTEENQADSSLNSSSDKGANLSGESLDGDNVSRNSDKNASDSINGGNLDNADVNKDNNIDSNIDSNTGNNTDSNTDNNNNGNEQGTEQYCFIEIQCKALSNNMDQLTSKELKGYIPEDGVILERMQVDISENDTAFSILQKATKIRDIKLEYQYTASFGTYYVQRINHLGEKDAGNMSGWMYNVNGEAPKVGASSYSVKARDVISWVYTCKGGTDL